MLCDVDPDGSKLFPKGIACVRDHKALSLPRGKMECNGQIRKVQILAVMLRDKFMDQKTGIFDRLNTQCPMRRKAAAKQGYVCGNYGVVLRMCALFNFTEKSQYGVLIQSVRGKFFHRIVYLKGGVQSGCIGTVKTVYIREGR